MGGLEGSKKSWRLETRASEAKGPFPGGKRVGSWGKKKSKKKAKTKGGGNQAANFPKPNIILILADDVEGILIMPHSMWFVDYLDCS